MQLFISKNRGGHNALPYVLFADNAALSGLEVDALLPFSGRFKEAVGVDFDIRKARLFQILRQLGLGAIDIQPYIRASP